MFFRSSARRACRRSITGISGQTPSSAKSTTIPGALQLSYWVDYWLGRNFLPSRGFTVAASTRSQTMRELEMLPVMNSDGSVVIMVANHAVNAPRRTTTVRAPPQCAAGCFGPGNVFQRQPADD